MADEWARLAGAAPPTGGRDHRWSRPGRRSSPCLALVGGRRLVGAGGHAGGAAAGRRHRREPGRRPSRSGRRRRALCRPARPGPGLAAQRCRGGCRLRAVAAAGGLGTDICAYFVGRSIGGPKLAPRISPGKTWAGLLGGMGGAGLIGGLVALAGGAGFWLAAPVAIVLAVVAQVGDLFESLLKRAAGVKDSGHLIPGHGGLLDRIDGLVFAAPVFAGLVWLGALGTAAVSRACRPRPTIRAASPMLGRHGLDRAQHAGAGRRGARALPGRGRDRLAAGRRAGGDRPRQRRAGWPWSPIRPATPA